jgi:flavin reductase (DIM6/NTAB) family NADH-FMN oxidoreductase RutF
MELKVSQQLENFRQSMRRLAATVCVISCERAGERFGITVTSVTSLCFSPLSILTCINRTSSITEPLLERREYCINVLKKSQADISRRFSGGLPASDRFLVGDWATDETGTPYLVDAQANLFCEVDQSLAYATHQILIGRVKSASFAEQVAPLVYQNGDYAACAPLSLSQAA